jgi:hypothetical protein
MIILGRWTGTALQASVDRQWLGVQPSFQFIENYQQSGITGDTATPGYVLA